MHAWKKRNDADQAHETSKPDGKMLKWVQPTVNSDQLAVKAMGQWHLSSSEQRAASVERRALLNAKR